MTATKQSRRKALINNGKSRGGANIFATDREQNTQTSPVHIRDDAEREIEQLLRKTYYDPKSAGSFGGVDPLLLHVQQLIRKAENAGLSQVQRRKVVENWLGGQESYTRHKQQRYHFERNKMISRGIDDIWQSDLCDMQPLARDNDGVRYLLIVIDTFSRYVWVRTLLNKTGAEVAAAFQTILQLGRQPAKLCTDMGKEYLNSRFQQLMIDYNIHHYSMASDTKAAIVERFNRTLKERMWRYFTHIHPAPKRYVDVLQDLVDSYNRRKHRMIGMAHGEVGKHNETKLWNRQFANQLLQLGKEKFSVGDRVRVGEKKSVFDKGYWDNWSREIFSIKEINKLHRYPMYYLEDGRGEPIKGAFYEQQLQKVIGDESEQTTNADRQHYEIEKIIGPARKINGVLHRYVKWRGFPKSQSQWIPAGEIRNIENRK